MSKNIYYILLMVILFMVSGTLYSTPSEKGYFVIGTNAVLYDSPGKDAKVILPLNEFDKVVLLKGKTEKNRLNITVNGTNGWMDFMNISVTPSAWTRFERIPGLTVSYPKEYNYQFRTNNYNTNSDIELLLYNDQSDVVIYHNFKNDFVQHSSEGIKINFYGAEVYYYFGAGGPEDNYVGYEFIIVDKKTKGYYVIDVNTGKEYPTIEQELTAKKILFSVRIKDSDSSEQPSSDQPAQIYTLTGDNVNVRAEAATNGAVLVKLSKGAKVTLLERSDAALTVGDKKGFWAFIDTGISKKDGEGTIKGWVFDYYLKEEK